MKKTKKQLKKITKYIRETSIVVIGVAITLSVSYWVTNRNEKRDTSLFLTAIKLELEENVRVLDITNQGVIQHAFKYSNYLMTHDKKSLNADSIKSYMSIIGNMTSIMFKTNAFDMFKSSGNMRLVDNRELLLSIWDTYSFLSVVQRIFDSNSEMKTEEFKKYFFQYSINPSDNDLLKNPPLYDVFVNMPIHVVQNDLYKEAMRLLNETISKF